MIGNNKCLIRSHITSSEESMSNFAKVLKLIKINLIVAFKNRYKFDYFEKKKNPFISSHFKFFPVEILQKLALTKKWVK